MPPKLHVFHFAMDGDTSGFFPQLARHHDRTAFQMTFGTLGPITPALQAQMDAAGVPVVSLGARRRAEYPLAMGRLYRELRRRRVDVFHAHLFDPCVVGLPVALAARVPLRVMTRHYSDYHTRIPKPFHVRLDRLATALCQRVIAVSQHTREVMVLQEKAPADKVVVVYNGIDFSRVQPSSAEHIARLRQDLGVQGRFVLAIAARLHPEKGYEYLLGAMPAIRRETGGAAHLLVAGAGLLQRHYQDMAAALGVADAVTFLGFRTDVMSIFGAADVVVLPSVAEAFGLVAAEVLYLGRPLVATTAGAIPEIVSHGETGLLVPPADSAALAEAVVTLYRQPQTRERLAAAGPASVATRFPFALMMQRYEELYLGAQPAR